MTDVARAMQYQHDLLNVGAGIVAGGGLYKHDLLMYLMLTHNFCEGAQPAWFAPVQVQLDNLQQQLYRMETFIRKVCFSL